MIVKYIGNTYKVSLIKGKLYEAEEKCKGIYAIVDESGEVYGFPSREFDIVEDDDK